MRRILPLLALAALLAAEGTDNHVLRALPRPGPVTIDGKLDDWDLSGRILLCTDVDNLAGSYSSWVSMMYDADALYVGVDWSDPTPMVNDYDPQIDVDRRKCFHSDSIQLHFRTDRESKLISWWYDRRKEAGSVALDGWYPWDANPIVYRDALKAHGVSEAFTKKADGSGYFQELRIPWATFSKKAYKAGEDFECMLDVVWGPDSGKGWPINHMMDLVAPGAAHNGWFWEVRQIYGKVELLAKGRLGEPMRAPAPRRRTEDPAGLIAVRAQIPDAKEEWFTLAIEDASGKRVRALPGGQRRADFLDKAAKDTVLQGWDGLDDFGKLVAPGRYRVVGMARGEITATYEQCFYNPGSPPWHTADGTGAWGSDHSPPGCVAPSPTGMVIGWGGVEGGHGLIGTDASGRKLWGNSMGARALTTDRECAYFMIDDFWSGKRGLGRVALADGTFRPWMKDGQSVMPWDVEVALGFAKGTAVNGLAIHAGKLILILGQDLIEIDAATLAVGRRMALAGAAQPAFLPDGRLFVLVGGRLERVDLDAKTATVVVTEGLGVSSALCATPDGNLVVADTGNDRQLKVLSPDGKVLRRLAKQGGRALRGPWDPQTIEAVSSLAVDANGLVWATECHDAPRRTSVWKADGTLARDFVGNASYAASGSYLHDQQPGLGFSGCVEFKLDPAARTWGVQEIMWRPDGGKGERGSISGSLATPQALRSSASGKPHEYLFCRSDWGECGINLLMRRPQGWRPIVVIDNLGRLLGAKEPSGDFAGCAASDGVVWNDANGDAIPQKAECEILPMKDNRSQIEFGAGWGTRIGSDMTIWVNGICRWKPLRFDAEGAPVYGLAGFERLPVGDGGDLVPLDADKTLFVLSSSGYGGTSYMRALEYGTWKELWRYPSNCHGVHGSHWAPMPSPGLVIGAIKTIGSASLTQGGSVLAIRGNLGQDFLITNDGLYIGELFRDSRLPSPPLPKTEAELAGKRVDECTEGGEPFNGFFARQDDGVVRIGTGIPFQAALVAQVHGLESIRRFKGGEFEVTAADLERAERTRAERAVASTRKKIAVRRLTPVVDGDAAEWKDVPVAKIERDGFPDRAEARLGWDDANLYACFQVQDASAWKNLGKEATHLFKTGDAVDLQLATDPAATGGEPGAAHLRLLLSQLEGKPVCVLMRPVDPSAAKTLAIDYRSPVGERHFDRVEVLAAATVAVKAEGNRYTIELAVPLAALGLKPKAGLVLRGDLGLLSSNSDGTLTTARTYWSNPATNLVNDQPSEAWLVPSAWGEFAFE